MALAIGGGRAFNSESVQQPMMDSKKRQLSGILFWHVSREFLIPFFCAILAFAFLFMVNDVFDKVGDFTSHKAPLHVFFLHILALQPHNLLNVVPVAVLLGTSFMTIMLGRNNELCAMRTAGLSLAVCALPVWIVAVAACISVGLISESWGQSCLEYAHSLEVQYTGQSKKQKMPIAFHNSALNRDWALLPAAEMNVFSNVVVRQFDESGTQTFSLIAAPKATGTEEGDWTFTNALVQKYGENGVAISSETVPELKQEYTETPRDMYEITNPMETVSCRQAWRLLNSSTIPQPSAAHRLRTVIWYNLTFPLASLVAALFGFSMTIANQRAEIMKGFAGAVGMLVLFYVVGQVLFVVGKNGLLPPFIGGAVPSLAFTAGGLFNVWRKQ